MAELVPIPSPGVPLSWGVAGDPLVVVLHDWYGRLPWLEPFAQALSSQNFRVVVPDLFGGVVTTADDDAQQLMAAMDVGAALAHIDDIVAEARAEGSPRAGTVGFSMGGWLALLHAQAGSVDAVAAYYATLASADHGLVPCPVLLQLAEFDEWGDGEEPQEFIERLKEHGTPVSDYVYLGTRHSFANATIREPVDARAAQLAFHRTVMFLRKHLHD